jgi:hypothetical protein
MKQILLKEPMGLAARVCQDCGGAMRLIGSEAHPVETETDLLTYCCVGCEEYFVQIIEHAANNACDQSADALVEVVSLLKPATPNARNCYERALKVHGRVAEAPDPSTRDEFLASEARWLKLAESSELSERLTNFLKRPAIFPKHPECAICHVPMWLVEIQSSCEKVEYFYECKACVGKLTIPEPQD